MSARRGIRKLTLRESHDTAWRFLHGMSWKLAMCCVTCTAGPNGEPVACAYRDGHPGTHSWATIPTFQTETAKLSNQNPEVVVLGDSE